ncbi:MAG: hypothetical protein AAGF24_06550 [Cyanobacteria bacterium P01_H01_bin.121]
MVQEVDLAANENALLADSVTAPQIDDLRGGSHLLWPIRLFDLALDTDMLPVLPLFGSPPPDSLTVDVKQRFQTFIQTVWQQNQNVFDPQELV